MSKTIAYIRTSTDKQDLGNQKLEIFEYAKKHKLNVDDFIQMSISSRRTPKERRIDEMCEVLNDADILIPRKERCGLFWCAALRPAGRSAVACAYDFRLAA